MCGDICECVRNYRECDISDLIKYDILKIEIYLRSCGIFESVRHVRESDICLRKHKGYLRY